MKKLILSLISLMLASTSFGQTADLDVSFTFDHGSLASEYDWGTSDTTYFSEYSWIYIDNSHAGNQWQIGRPQKAVFNAAHSLPNALVTDTVNACLPNDTSIVYFGLPTQLGAGLAGISFYYKLNVGSGDVAAIDYSLDTGATWANALADTSIFVNFEGLTNLVNTGLQWDSIYLLPFYIGLGLPDNNMLLRFSLITDSSTTPRDGFMIDDVVIAYVSGEGVPPLSLNNPISIYPNPTNDLLNISSTGKINTISIANLSGQLVCTRPCNSQTATIDVSTLPPGIYAVLIDDKITQKFVKR